MAVSRANGRPTATGKATQDHPKELFGAQGPIFWGLRRRSNAKGALECRGRVHRTATEAVSLGLARITGGSTPCSNGIRRRRGA